MHLNALTQQAQAISKSIKKRKSIKAQHVIQKDAYKTFYFLYVSHMKAALVTT